MLYAVVTFYANNLILILYYFTASVNSYFEIEILLTNHMIKPPYLTLNKNIHASSQHLAAILTATYTDYTLLLK